ncbi:hypothetical protein [Rhizobium grahamii]|uniref:Transmembrane protein n=1 Tax=Rhizobium grahamii CCGE 502 TaxID=990285 RepID=S3HBU6_9HYPH|nr:hypothetical protein [Rhizobium grahamii]EPE95695.1 transmembrane protein [Rhizobium grahamii CCGE 502]
MASNGFDPMTSWARLSERVENQGKDIVDLRSNMNTGFQTINSAISTLSNELRTNSKTQWPVIWSAAGVCFTILAALGAFFYGTLSKGQDRLDTAIVETSKGVQASLEKMTEKMVTQKELEWRTARSSEDRQRTDIAIKDIRDNLVPRAEHQRVWQNYDDRSKDFQRQIDEIKQAQGSVYGQRDFMLDIRERLDRLERDRARAAATP